MTPQPASTVYKYPRWYAIGYRWNTGAECDFLEACWQAYGATGATASTRDEAPAKMRVLDVGCGAGRHLLELARRGHRVTGFDVQPEMVAFVKDEARKEELRVDVSVGDLRDMALRGTYDLAMCVMDTFRFLLTNDEIVAHLREIGEHVSPGGLYVTDFWVPMRWDQIANEIHQWEQTEGDTTVRVFYLQHPESVDPISQTFEDELIFSVDEDGQTHEIRGDRTRTRLILPQEFRALVEASGVFELVDAFGDFDLQKPFESANVTWRMISVLKKRASPPGR